MRLLLEQMHEACEVLKGFGLCEEMKDVMALDCPKSCGFCAYLGPKNCKNHHSSRQCRAMKIYCGSSSPIGNLVRQNCAFTCGCPDTKDTTLLPRN